jgi:hypothetical protein
LRKAFDLFRGYKPEPPIFSLADRLLNGNSQHLETWLRLVDREGDVRRLAELGD